MAWLGRHPPNPAFQRLVMEKKKNRRARFHNSHLLCTALTPQVREMVHILILVVVQKPHSVPSGPLQLHGTLSGSLRMGRQLADEEGGWGGGG